MNPIYEQHLKSEAFKKSEANKALKKRSDKMALLEAYSLFLEKNGYLDIDWRAEEPFALDVFMEENKL